MFFKKQIPIDIFLEIIAFLSNDRLWLFTLTDNVVIADSALNHLFGSVVLFDQRLEDYEKSVLQLFADSLDGVLVNFIDVKLLRLHLQVSKHFVLSFGRSFGKKRQLKILSSITSDMKSIKVFKLKNIYNLGSQTTNFNDFINGFLIQNSNTLQSFQISATDNCSEFSFIKKLPPSLNLEKFGLSFQEYEESDTSYQKSTFINDLVKKQIHLKLTHLNLLAINSEENSSTIFNQFDKFVEVKFLTFLNLSLNNLTSVPTLSYLVNLKKLVFQMNDIQKIENLNGLINLEILDLSKNQIQNIENLSSLINLRKLKLDQNEIKEIKNIDSLTKLKHLNLSLNELEKIKGLESLVALTYLDLSRNELVLIENLLNLKLLTYLNLESNQISDVSEISLLENIVYLNLSSNKIEEISDLFKLKNLRKLDLCSNEIKDTSKFNLFQNLQSLNLSMNKIDTFLVDLDTKLSTLKYLKLNSNNINAVQNIKELFDLESLELDGNKITEFSDEYASLKKLKNLSLSSNLIEKYKSNEIFESLKTLDLNHNLLKDFVIKNGCFPNIINLFLFSNNLEGIKFVDSVKECDFWLDLEILDLGNNSIKDLLWTKDIPASIRNKIDLSGNTVEAETC
ncbi:leucine-rich repeat domain-containing protein [Ascoidea rubescens DSM 1968]|uniref:L domain-like protein n=1 Tax=Ascoidea rubescens DSM 1968 TaxID=1344418 RepID=A0A1D2VJQ7_9ASCO|nr:L domain-like protein [Ascoidea rubescens DSM 1968]ODV61861.1 L domain-like protein [Ascoidea rubescens DSM 1968]